jgi:3-hydroxyacyl-[acyl-carrier-protein] dehydratase
MGYARAAMLDAVQIQKILPHRFPFLFIDRVLEVTPGESIVAVRLVSNSDPILQGHFPGNPILPGVVQVEAMAQAAVILANASGHFDPELHDCFFIGIADAKFRAPVVPGEILQIRVKAERLGRVGKFSGEITTDAGPKSSATFTAILQLKSKREGG